jgi:tetraacyldisaccharide 4'-kinase
MGIKVENNEKIIDNAFYSISPRAFYYIYTNMKYLRLLLLPFSIIYGSIIGLRNILYNLGIYKTRKFFIPVITVGNLDVGGAGKSPMTEYLVSLLKSDYRLATLSRGYGRKTTGFINSKQMNLKAKVPFADKIGDEPAQFRQKFPDITVAVCEDRVSGIKSLKEEHNLIILDDAYQHRSVKGAISILMFDYNKILDFHFVLPAGNLREPFMAKRRAQIFVVSKCPGELPTDEQEKILNRLKPTINQKVFFTAIKYEPLKNMENGPAGVKINKDTTVFLLTGIANPGPMVQYMKTKTDHIVHHNYPDHHSFTLKNIAKLAGEFSACKTAHKVVITTEKDAQRLVDPKLAPLIEKLNILVQPIGIEFLNGAKKQFDQLMINDVREYTQYHQLY